MPSIYIHIPYCLSKCRYCGFNSQPVKDNEILESYCGALFTEIQRAAVSSQHLDTVYFGGGTPSILSHEQLQRVLGAISTRTAIAPATELTIEANPETLSAEKLSALRALGFNRLSIGVQSFDDGLLRLMGRPHDARQAVRAFEAARQAGFDNIGLDLIFALSGQTHEQWERDLVAALRLQPEHISLYSLTYEKDSEFTRQRAQGKLSPCDEDAETEMYLIAIERMQAAGYGHYEVSNFARPGFRSRHNLNYWRCGDYRGFGAGAHSHQGNRRWANHADPADYAGALNAGRSAAGFEELLTRGQQLFEAIFLGLRMTEGIDIAGFEAQWGVSPLAHLPGIWDSLSAKGLVEIKNGIVRLTGRGLLLADSVLAELAP